MKIMVTLLLFLVFTLCACRTAIPQYYNSVSPVHLSLSPSALLSIPAPSCARSLAETLMSPSSARFLSLILNSGKGFSDLGNYPACKSSNDSYYVMLGAYIFGLAMRTGLCLPKDCTISELVSSKKWIAGILGSAAGTRVSEEDVFLSDVREDNRKAADRGTGYYAFCAICATFLLACLGATVADRWDLLKSEESGLAKLTRCFSLQRNCGSLFNTKNRVDPNLDILNGVRVLSMVWIMFGHTYDFGSRSPILNVPEFFRDISTNYWMSLLTNGILAVDVFFFFSGFLAALSFFRVFKRPENRRVPVVLLSYLVRYLRLFPLLFVALLYRFYVERGFRDQPCTPGMDYDIKQCTEHWYLTLGYVANLQEKFSSICIDWSWYLMNDMQFFLICPIIVLPFAVFSRRTGFLVTGICAVAAAVGQAILMGQNDITPYTENYWNMFYIKPYCRVIPYFIGIAFYFVYEGSKTNDADSLLGKIKAAVRDKTWIRCAMYIMAAAMIYVTIFARHWMDMRKSELSQAFFIFYEVTDRVFFIIGLILLIYPTLIGAGEFLSSVLGHPMFNPLAKLTYGAYLVHPFLYIQLYSFAMSGLHFTHTLFLFNFFAIVAVSYPLSFAATMLFESPVGQIVRTFLEPARKANAEPVDQTTEGINRSLLEKRD